MAKRTKGRRRRLKPRILIMCEGETERNYFQAIKESEAYKRNLIAVNPQVIKAKHSAPEMVVNEAIRREKEARKENNPYDAIWVVFDHDHSPNRKKAYDAALKADFKVAFSAICFEIWYLLHFVKTSRNFRNAHELIKELKKHYTAYQKAQNNDFEKLKNNLATAYTNSQWLRKRVKIDNQHITSYQCWTDVDILVKTLISIKT